MRDRFNLYAKGGDGGNGSTSFRRSRHDRRGKPDGQFSLNVSLSVTILSYSYMLVHFC